MQPKRTARRRKRAATAHSIGLKRRLHRRLKQLAYRGQTGRRVKKRIESANSHIVRNNWRSRYAAQAARQRAPLLRRGIQNAAAGLNVTRQ